MVKLIRAWRRSQTPAPGSTNSHRRTLVFAREGAIQDPRAEIDARMKAMES